MRITALILIPAIALLGWLGWQLIGTPSEPIPAAAPASTPTGPPPDVIVADQAAVFKRAFWRRPSADDEILHAERREWRDAEGLTRWQWFIAVKASPELLKYLRDDNTFGLAPAESAMLPDEKPPWFSFDPSQVTVLSSRHGKMQLVFQSQDNLLYASDEGGGFQRGAPEPEPSAPVRSAPIPGRLPNSPPPTPQP